MVSEIAVRDKICTKNGSKIAMMHNVLNFEVDHVCNWILYQVSFTPWEYTFLGHRKFSTTSVSGLIWYLLISYFPLHCHYSNFFDIKRLLSQTFLPLQHEGVLYNSCVSQVLGKVIAPMRFIDNFLIHCKQSKKRYFKMISTILRVNYLENDLRSNKMIIHLLFATA